MVPRQKKLTPLEYLSQFCPEATVAFQGLRAAVVKSGPLDRNTCELITLGAFATARIEEGFKTHARCLLDGGVSPEALRQAVLVTFGATTTFAVALDALNWIDDLVTK
ncbi:MAG: carboxymuconolactone decarboxylase family protein [Candidatus Binatia bacterium]